MRTMSVCRVRPGRNVERHSLLKVSTPAEE